MPIDDLLQSVWDWRKRGGLAGSLGLQPAEAGLAMMPPYRPGMSLGDMIPQNWMENPLLGGIPLGDAGTP